MESAKEWRSELVSGLPTSGSAQTRAAGRKTFDPIRLFRTTRRYGVRRFAARHSRVDRAIDAIR
jgi:hypothetical protein